MNENMTNIITLKDGYGTEVNFEFLDLIEYQGTEYVVLLPVDDEDSTEVVILRVEPGDINADEESYISVEDEDTLLTVFAMFKEKFKEEFNFTD